MVSFGVGHVSKHPSFPRKRESTLRTFGDVLFTEWIPALAGMTATSGAQLSQMTPLRGSG